MSSGNDSRIFKSGLVRGKAMVPSTVTDHPEFPAIDKVITSYQCVCLFVISLTKGKRFLTKRVRFLIFRLFEFLGSLIIKSKKDFFFIPFFVSSGMFLSSEMCVSSEMFV